MPNEKMEKYGAELENLLKRAIADKIYILPYVKKENGTTKAGFAIFDQETENECCLQIYDDEERIGN